MFDPVTEVRQRLQQYQDGYTRRDPAAIAAFMELFAAEPELIGTNGIKPGVEEWYTSREGVQRMTAGDWKSWGDVRLDVDAARIQVHGEVAWLATSGTVSLTIPAEENYRDFLEYVKSVVDEAQPSPEEKLLYILRGGLNTIYELRRGENFVWPLRFTAVLVKENERWQFAQVQFSLPTIYFPDVRVI